MRRNIHETSAVEAVLRETVSMEQLERKKPKSKSQKRAIWGWTVSEIEQSALPTFGFGNPNLCAYCGQLPQSRDHVIPVSYQSDRRRNWTEFGPWCWACLDCNSALTNRYFDSFKARCEWAQWRIEAKAKPIDWHKWELERLDRNLRSHIQTEMKKREWLRARADFYGSREFYLNLESLVWQIAEVRSMKGVGAKFLCAYFSSLLSDIATIYRPEK